MRWNFDDELMSYPSDMSHAQKTKKAKKSENQKSQKKGAGFFTTSTDGRTSGIGGTEDIDLLGRGLNMDVTNAVVSSD
jgi:hypothetical protein